MTFEDVVVDIDSQDNLITKVDSFLNGEDKVVNVLLPDVDVYIVVSIVVVFMLTGSGFGPRFRC